MTNSIAQFFGVDDNSPETRLAVDQVSIDRNFLEELVALRHRDAPDAEKFAATPPMMNFGVVVAKRVSRHQPRPPSMSE